MNIKQQAYNLFKEGKSYKEIALELSIGKTTAYDYVKEMRMNKGMPVPNGSEPAPNVRSERQPFIPNVRELKPKANITKALPVAVPNVPNAKSLEGFTGDDLLKMKFDTLVFTGRFLELIGKPEKRFSGIIWGLPKGGKSNLSLRFADYLQEYFGKVLYIAAEEGKSVSMQDKIKAIGGSDVTFLQSRDREEIRGYIKAHGYDFIFIDSINVVGIDDLFLENIKQENPKTSFVAIVQATKGGNFKGEQSLEHNCDFVIKVVNGIAYHKGRFGPESEIPIFEQPLYEKNGNKVKSKEIVAESKKKERAVVSNSSVINIPKEVTPLILDDVKIEVPANFRVPIAKVRPLPQKGSLLKNVLMITGVMYLGNLILSSSSSEKG
jgi:hypothetical protein